MNRTSEGGSAPRNHRDASRPLDLVEEVVQIYFNRTDPGVARGYFDTKLEIASLDAARGIEDAKLGA
jgi:hypothetical protein